MLNGTSFFPYCPSKSLLIVVRRHNTVACPCPSSSSTGSEASLMTPHQFRFSCYVSPLSYMIPCTTHSSTTLLIPAVVSGSTCRRLFLAVPRPVFHHNAACTFRSPIIPQCTTPPPPASLSRLAPSPRPLWVGVSFYYASSLYHLLSKHESRVRIVLALSFFLV